MAARRTRHDDRNDFWVGPARPKDFAKTAQILFIFCAWLCVEDAHLCVLLLYQLSRYTCHCIFYNYQCLGEGGTSLIKVYLWYSRIVRKGTLFSSFTEIYYFQTSLWRNVCTITGGSSMSLRYVVIYRFISSHFQEKNAIPVSVVFVVTSTQPFALAQPRKNEK